MASSKTIHRSLPINTTTLRPRHHNNITNFTCLDNPNVFVFSRSVLLNASRLLLKERKYHHPIHNIANNSLLSRRVLLNHFNNKNSRSSFSVVQSFKEDKMTISPAVKISNGRVTVKDRTVLESVPENVVSTAAAASGPMPGVFVGVEFDEPRARQVASLGVLRGVRFMACFRFKLWWMAQKMGDSASQIPFETQFLLLETRGEEPASGCEPDPVIYTVFLPLIEGPFRTCLQGNNQDELELCLESGDKDTTSSSFTHSLYIGAGTDPYTTITNAIGVVKSHLNTFKQLHEKRLPGIVDYFGWCTWDAFYQEVTQEGVEAGLATLTAGGTPPKFVIIDDGWQSVGTDSQLNTDATNHDQREPQLPAVQDEQQSNNHLLSRLTDIKENTKFQNKDDPSTGISNIVKIAKEKYGLKYVYVWHAIVGYWGGVRPEAGNEMEQYGSLLKYPDLPKGVLENEPTWKYDVLALQGLGLMDPNKVYQFYDDLHSYLAKNGVDGVKVDVQCILETLGSGLGGRVALTKQYHQALDASVARNFPDNGCIACMSHNTDALYCAKQTAIVRASDDFFPRDQVSHTIHIAAVAYNSVFLGEFMQPDWDMFHSLHSAGEYHASARGISGGPVYISDAPGKHNFELLKKLVLPDGSILRARLPGRPTKDCLFNDPTRDGLSLLKIWNMNKYTGVLGVYNCQGAAWCGAEHKNIFHPTNTEAITGFIRGQDIHLISEASTDPSQWDGGCVIYSHQARQLTVLPAKSALPISLKVLEFDVFTITPIKILDHKLKFGPLGLIEMFNAGGAIEGLRYIGANGAENAVEVCAEVKGFGKFGAYSSIKPIRCLVGEQEIEVNYDADSSLLTLVLAHMPEENTKVHSIRFEF